MKTNELLQAVMNVTRLPKTMVREVLIVTGEVIAEALAEQPAEKIVLPGFGYFRARTSPTRIIQCNLRDPAESKLVGGARRARFVASKPFAERVNKGAV